MSDLIPIRVAEQACANLQAEIERLKAEVERLRKAGDVMCEVLEEIAKREGLFGFMSAKEWLAAKEGKQS